MHFLRALILDGNLPGRAWVSRLLLTLAWLTPLGLFFGTHFKDYGNWGWWLLTLILVVRPLAQILPQLGIFRVLTSLRRELGIWCATLLLSHGAGFFMQNNLPVWDTITAPLFWDFSAVLSWGALGIVVLLPLLLTSNNYALRFLGKYWKVVQKLTYLLYFFGALHLITMGKWEAAAQLGLVIFLLLAARLGWRLRFS